jgi:outer membrane protein assembly factor BamB
MGANHSKTAWRLIAGVAAIFLLLVGGTMIVSDLRLRLNDPLKSARLKDFKDRLRQNPGDEDLKKQIRQFDLDLRSQYFRHIGGKDSGGYLLLGAAALFVVAMNRSSTRQLPSPNSKQESSSDLDGVSRGLVVAIGVTAGAILLVTALSMTTTGSRRTAEIEKLLGPETSQVAERSNRQVEPSNANWSRFRGADGGGAASLTNAPVIWDVKTGNGVAWKVATPGSGYNSPILWENRLFLSGVNETECSVYAFNTDNGQMLWLQPVAGVGEAFKTASPAIPVASRANATMATDGERVYAFFGSGDLVSFSKEGKQAWQKALGPLSNMYGHAASIVIWQGKLILQLDQGEAEAGKSKLYALDGRTGQVLWQRSRRVGSSWATPIIIEAAGKTQIITLAVPSINAYSAVDGGELWRVEGLNGEITPSPAFGAGFVFAVSPSEKLFAIRPDGSGDVTRTKVAWSTEENVPDITSPVCDGKLLFTLTTPGVLTCFNAGDGKKQWEHDFAMEFHSSPSIAAGRIYLFSRTGTAIIVDAAAQFKEVFRTEMGDAFDASPAFADGRIFIRGETNVWCIGPTTQKVASR